MAGPGHTRQPGRLDSHRGPQPPARPVEVARLPDDRPTIRSNLRHNRVRRRRHSRSASGADAGVRPPGDRPQLPHAVDAADGARRRSGGRRGGVRGARRDNGAAPGPRQTPHPRRPHSVRAARPRRPRRTAARGVGGGVRRVCNRLQAAGAAIESLSAEALHLALVLADLLPDQPEALGLAALVCLSESRRGARRTGDGAFVPLEQQDTRLWDAELIARGEALLC
ncbi:MAG: DUF6596 domain-containing protein, partial [Pseudonocardiaceae bacterium]